MGIKKGFCCYLLLALALVTIASLEASARKTKNNHKHKLWRLVQKKDEVTGKHQNYVNSENFRSLEKKFETIRDLGSIVRCRLHSDGTTIVTGNNLICGGKRYTISREAAQDVEVPASTRQGIISSPAGNPLDVESMLHSGIYGKPIMSFLGESGTQATKTKFLEPHDKYPILGIYDHSMRGADPAISSRSKTVSMSFEERTPYDDSFEDLEGEQHKNFGSMELKDISEAVNSGDDKTGREESFYRDEEAQSNAFSANGMGRNSNNPFGQYWKSLKNNFYVTTASQLAPDNPLPNGEMKTKIPRKMKSSIKKSSIQTKQGASGSLSRANIPKPNEKKTTLKKKIESKKLDLSKKRYFIFGQQNSRVPMGMFAGVPAFGPWQYRMATRRSPMQFAAYNNAGQMQVNHGMGINPDATQQGITRSFPSPIPFAAYNNVRQMHSMGINTDAIQQGNARSFQSADEWGTRSGQRFFDPLTTGSPVRVPIDPLYAQMKANEYIGEPGRPFKGRFQYGIQPGNGPPFLGFASVPIMQPVPMGEQQSGPGSLEDPQRMHGSLENEENPFSRGLVPFSINQGPNFPYNYGRNFPGIVQGTENVATGLRQLIGLPVENNEMNSAVGGADETLAQQPDGGSSYMPQRMVSPQEDASKEFESISDPERFVPAPFYRTPMYNPHESEQFFPDGTNKKFRKTENDYLTKEGYTNQINSYNGKGENDAAQSNSDDMQQEQEQEQENEEENAQKRGHLSKMHLDVHGTKINTGPRGAFMYTKEHVGFGPITVEAKTAKSALNDNDDS